MFSWNSAKKINIIYYVGRFICSFFSRKIWNKKYDTLNHQWYASIEQSLTFFCSIGSNLDLWVRFVTIKNKTAFDWDLWPRSKLKVRAELKLKTKLKETITFTAWSYLCWPPIWHLNESINSLLFSARKPKQLKNLYIIKYYFKHNPFVDSCKCQVSCLSAWKSLFHIRLNRCS